MFTWIKSIVADQQLYMICRAFGFVNSLSEYQSDNLIVIQLHIRTGASYRMKLKLLEKSIVEL